MTVGVLMATYNSTRFLQQALDSISAQTRQPDEVIIVDDASTDRTLEMVTAWSSRQSFAVKMLRSERPSGGPASGRDRGLRQASAELLAMLDHDDLFLPDNLARLAGAFQRHPSLVLAFGDAREFSESPEQGGSLFAGKQIAEVSYEADQQGFRLLGEEFFASLLIGSYVPTMATLFSRKAAIEAGGFHKEMGTADDAHLWMRLSKSGRSGYYPDVLGCKRVHEHNLSHPRHNLALTRSQYRAVSQMLEDADRWRLTASERQRATARQKELAGELLYHASRSGFTGYWAARREVGDSSIHWRNLAVSLARSLGIAPAGD